MANITLHRVGELIRCVFELLWNRPEGMLAREIIALIPEVVALNDHELGWSPASNTPRYEKIIRLATVPLVKAGWLVKNERGRWYITEIGRQACKKFSNVQEMYAEALRLSEAGKQSTPELLMFLEIVQEKSWQYIEAFLQEQKPMDIRLLLAALMEAMQYHITWLAPAEKKHGHIDMILNVDPLGVNSCRILVQIKHKGQAVTVEGVKSFLSILGPNDFGLLFSTGGFTSDVMDELSSSIYQKINAMDLTKFFDLWIKNYDKVSDEARMRLPLKNLYFLAPLDPNYPLSLK
jgi:restriction system protein